MAHNAEKHTAREGIAENQWKETTMRQTETESGVGLALIWHRNTSATLKKKGHIQIFQRFRVSVDIFALINQQWCWYPHLPSNYSCHGVI